MMDENRKECGGCNYSFINHRTCEYFPCHKDIKEEDFNCLFCFCPLYFLGDSCGGAFCFTAGGVKDCSFCTFPHKRENYDAIIRRLSEAIENRKF